MRKTLLFAALAAVMSFVSCTQEPAVSDQSVSDDLVFTATISTDTKTTVDISTGKVSWNENDWITISDGSNVATYAVSEINGSHATFVKRSGDALRTSGVTYTATYGDTECAYFKDEICELMMTATSTTTSLHFTVTSSLLKLILSKEGETIRYIGITGTPDGEDSPGYYGFSINPPVSINTPATFVFALPAGNYNKFLFQNDDYYDCEITASEGKALTIAANSIQPVSFTSSLRFAPEFATLDFDRILYNIPADNNIKAINFHADSPVTTSHTATTDFPIYYSVSDDALDIYTKAGSFKARSTDFSVSNFPKVEHLDLTDVDFSGGIGSLYIQLPSLRSLEFNKEKPVKITRPRFGYFRCPLLESLDLSMFDVSDVEDFESLFSGCPSLKNLDVTGWNTSKATSFVEMFAGCSLLESLDISMFNTSSAVNLTGMFRGCSFLTALDVTNFNTSNVQSISTMFNGCSGLRYLDLSSFELPESCQAYNSIALLGDASGSCIVKCSPAVYQKIVDGQGTQVETVDWRLTGPFELYESQSYAKDGTVKKLQTATVGNGIDIVFMGDAFSDRMIDNGDYDEVMNAAMEGLFSEEPFKSCRNFFNVYSVTAVSKNELLAYETALDGEGFPLPHGNIVKIINYAKLALGEDRSNDNAYICVLAHTDVGGGTGTISGSGVENDYGAGTGIAYMGYSNNLAEIPHMVLHELGGHSFAKLGDEYWASAGTIPQEGVDAITEKYNKFGFYKNIDFTDNPATVKWNKFISDPRYASESIGVYQGGLTYPYGVWRSSYNSVMNQMVPSSNKFNAPSREAIYYKINKLAYGPDWVYDYETFVKFDLKL